MLDYEIITVGQLECNCTILWDAQSKMGVVVDPGDEAGRILARVKKNGISIQAILLTHAHFDHVGGAAELQIQWGCGVFLHPDDLPLIERLGEQTATYGFPPKNKPNVTPMGSKLPLRITAINTPGHSPGSSIFLADSISGKVVLSGDTLFCGGVGRTDLWGGNWKTLENSIRTHLYTLEPDSLVIPGHGPNTTIETERRSNSFIRY